MQDQDGRAKADGFRAGRDKCQRADGVQPAHIGGGRKRAIIRIGIFGCELSRPADVIAHPSGMAAKMFSRLCEVYQRFPVYLSPQMRQVNSPVHNYFQFHLLDKGSPLAVSCQDELGLDTHRGSPLT